MWDPRVKTDVEGLEELKMTSPEEKRTGRLMALNNDVTWRLIIRTANISGLPTRCQKLC